MKKKVQQISYLLFIPIIILVMTLLFVFSWKYDNKYTHKSPQAIGGFLILNETDFEKTPYLFLTHGWNYYADLLLTPDTIQNVPITETIFIGQYPGFERDKQTVSSHGAATYQMTLILPEESQQYALYIPEIFSAYQLYINGSLVMQHGIPEKEQYIPRIQSDLVLFEASSQTELIFAVSDYSHFYSGIQYPPTFGLAGSVLNLLEYRTAFGMFIFSMAFCLGCFHLSIGIAMHKQPLVLSILFAAISFCCAFIMAFPLFHSLLETSICPWYALEFFLRSLLLLLVCILAGILAHTKKLPLYLAVGIGSIFCVATLLGSLFSSYCNANTLNLFSAINRFYKLLCAVWILFISIPVLFQHKPFSRLIYSAVLVFSLSLIAEFSIPLFEPIHFGWFSEIAAIFLVLILGVVLWTSIIEQYRTSIQLSLDMKHMDAQIALQQKHYEELTEQIEEIRQFRHDTRHHFKMIHQLLYNQKLNELQDYLSELIEFSPLSTPLSFCSIYPLDALLKYYYTKADSLQIHLTVRVSLPDTLQIHSSDLCVIFGNLLENACEACQLVENKREIYLHAQMTGRMMKLEIRNTYKESSLKKEGETYLSSKKPERIGIGLRSVQAITAKYNGILEVKQEQIEQDSWFIVQLFLGKV